MSHPGSTSPIMKGCIANGKKVCVDGTMLRMADAQLGIRGNDKIKVSRQV